MWGTSTRLCDRSTICVGYSLINFKDIEKAHVATRDEEDDERRAENTDIDIEALKAWAMAYSSHNLEEVENSFDTPVEEMDKEFIITILFSVYVRAFETGVCAAKAADLENRVGK